MLNLSLNDVARAEVRVQGELAPDQVLEERDAATAVEPFSVDGIARAVGTGVLVQGRVRGRLEIPCRRCLATVELPLDEEMSLWFEPLEGEVGDGEVYPLPPRGADLDLADPLREQILLKIPDYVLCTEDCRGLCPHCGTDLNQTECGCVPAPSPGPWDALKSIEFD